MKLSSSLPVWLYTVLGAAGTVIHLAHRRTCYDEGGYIIPGKALTTLLVALALTMTALAFVYALVYSRKHTVLRSMPAAFSPRIPLGYLISCIAAALLLAVFAGYHFLTAIYETRGFRIAGTAANVLALVSAPCAVILAVRLARRRKGTVDAYLAAFIGLFFCLWMALHFINNRINPVILSFCMECVAFGCTSMFLFALGGAAGATQSFSTVFFGLMSVGFSLLALTGQQVGREDLLVLAASVLLVAPNLMNFFRNVPQKTDSSTDVK